VVAEDIVVVYIVEDKVVDKVFDCKAG